VKETRETTSISKNKGGAKFTNRGKSRATPENSFQTKKMGSGNTEIALWGTQGKIQQMLAAQKKSEKKLRC